MLIVDKLTSPSDLSTIRDEWASLDQTIVPRTPFTGPTWYETWWKWFRRDSILSRDEFLVYTLRDPNGALVGVAPMMRTGRPSFGPLRLREVQFFGADRNVTELRGPVCRAEDQPEVLGALAAHFSRHDLGWNWIRWHGIRRDKLDSIETLSEASRFRWTRSLPDYILELPPAWPTFEKGLTSRVRKKVRSCYRLLERGGHVIEFRVIREQKRVASALDTFYSLHGARAKIRHSDVFGNPTARSFLSEYADIAAARDEVRFFQIAIEDVVVATRVGFQFGSELYLYHAGNDPAWDAYSIMTTLLAEIIKWAIDAKVTTLNLSTGMDRSKTRWKPIEIVYSDGVQVAPGIASHALWHIYDTLREQIYSGSAMRRLAGIRKSPDPALQESAAEAAEAD
jgi:CelD/BcsL family acetyltransferase involved in cellulose biosynthesis